MEVLLCDAAVLKVKDAVESLYIEQVHLLQIFKGERNAAQLLPHHWSKMQV